MGVRTPEAAEVAEATVGFARLVHMPNGKMFTNGLLSMMFAIGVAPTTRLVGRTSKEDGATPMEHMRVAPAHANVPTK